MKLFGQLVRTAVNVVVLPVTLPSALIKDAITVMEGDAPRATSRLAQDIKREAGEQ